MFSAGKGFFQDAITYQKYRISPINPESQILPLNVSIAPTRSTSELFDSFKAVRY